MFFTKKEVPVVVVDPIESLQTQSEAAISIITDTLTKLENTRTSIEIEDEKEQSVIDTAQARKNKLSEMREKNTKFAAKLNQLFE